MAFLLPSFILLVILLVPNLLYLRFPPRNALQTRRNAGPLFGLFEHIGRVACMGSLVFSGGTLYQGSRWFVLACMCIAMYYAMWIQYVSHDEESSLLLAPLGPVPIPGTVEGEEITHSLPFQPPHPDLIELTG